MSILQMALAIVLAVIILQFLPFIFIASIFLIIIAICIAVGVGIVYLVFNYPSESLTIGAMILVIAFAFFLPSWIGNLVVSKYPIIGALINGTEPYNKISKFPQRFIVTAFAAFGLVGTAFMIIFLGAKLLGGFN